MYKAVILFLSFTILFTAEASAKDKLRIGTFDSRMVAIYYFRSPDFQKEMGKLMTDFKAAKEKKDTAMIKKLEEKGQLQQRIAHDKGFGRGSVSEIMEKQSESLKELAKKENLAVIVSKWELNYSSPDVEIVDITLKIMDIFKAPVDVKKMYDEMKGVKPIEDAFFIED